jgi:hypothetical protein
VLRDLGWKLQRIWSTDWWTDPEREIGKLEAALAKAREADSAVTIDRSDEGQHNPAGPSPTETALTVSPRSPGHSQTIDPPDSALERYRPVEIRPGAGSQEEFYEPAANWTIRKLLIDVVRQEGPISLTLAARRVAGYWGFERVRAKALRRIRHLIPRDEVLVQSTDAGVFLWPRDLDPKNFSSFRVPDAAGNGARDAIDLPLEEIGSAVVYLLELNMSTPLEELVRETARLFGFGRVGTLVADRIHAAVNALIERGVARAEGGTISLSP